MKNRNTLVKSKAFVNTVGIKGADLEDEFLFQILAAFRRAYMCCLEHGTKFFFQIGTLNSYGINERFSFN